MYELGLWFAVRDALRAGRLYRPVSRRCADPASFLMPTARWQTERDELAVTFGRPLDAAERLAQLELDQRAQLQRLQARSTLATACAWSAAAWSSTHHSGPRRRRCSTSGERARSPPAAVGAH